MKTKTSIIVDKTNLTKASRKRLLSQVPSEYKKIAIYLDTVPLLSYLRQSKRVGKVIPDNIWFKQLNQLEVPTEDEGFDEIIRVSE